ncbi:MAG TPA: amino acid ABC transporter substrate-binding protein [Methylomirabilota bacterium]|nr:amino acid ABC transporter substrate-binding protein [Methylomirabilota bacterium]
MRSRLRSRSRTSVVGVLLVAVAWTGPALGQELDGTLKKIKTSGTFAIGYRESSPPFSFVGQDKRPVGYSIDLCLHVAGAIQRQLGLADLKLGWVPVTPETRISAVVRGTVDIECGSTTASLSRQEQVDFSLMTFVDGGSLMTTAAGTLRGLGELGNQRIGVVRGTTTEKALTAFLAKEGVKVQMVNVKDHAEGLAALQARRIDAYASDRGILLGLALTTGDPRRFAVANVLFSYEPYALMLRRNDAAFRLAVNRALAELYRSGKVSALYDRWFGTFGKPNPALQSMYLLNGLPE